MDLKDLKACVKLVLPLQCDTRECEITEETMNAFLEDTQHKVPLRELQVVYEESGDFDQTALALEHLRYNSSNMTPCLEIRTRIWVLFLSDMLLFVGFFISTSGGSGMRKTRMMTLTILFVVWSLVSDCEHTLSF